MAVKIKDNIITLNTKNTTYQMAVNENDFLAHLYYGNRLDDSFALERKAKTNNATPKRKRTRFPEFWKPVALKIMRSIKLMARIFPYGFFFIDYASYIPIK